MNRSNQKKRASLDKKNKNKFHIYKEIITIYLIMTTNTKKIFVEQNPKITIQR